MIIVNLINLIFAFVVIAILSFIVGVFAGVFFRDKKENNYD